MGFFLLACFGGALVAIQAALNSRLRYALGDDAIGTVFLSFCVGMTCIATLMVLRGALPGSERAILPGPLPATSWWLLLGGACGAGYVLSLVIGVPRIGVAWCMAGVLLGQQITAVLLDASGASGMAPIPIAPERLLGLGCLFLGAWLLTPR